METKIKWNEGDGFITATYEGSGSGSASISSDVNEGIDRVQSVKVETTDKSVSAELVVSQVGLREVFEPSDGLFVVADGGTFNVLKVGGEQPDVPSLYTELEYIETSGTQWVDTGVKAPLVADVRVQGINGSSNSRIVLSTDGSANGGRWFGFKKVWTVGASTYDFVNAYNEIVDASCSYSESAISVTIDGVTKTRNGSQSGTLYIGAPSSTYPAHCRIFGVKIYKNDELVRNLIPVLDLDNVVCLYDKVGKGFLYNKGADNFIAGYKTEQL